jgi:hypothetical protein
MQDPRPSCDYSLDAADRLVAVSEAWLEFARENGAPQLDPQAVMHRSIWAFVAGQETRHLYRVLFERVRKRGTSLSVPFRCDSPERIRFMELRMHPAAGEGIDCSGVLLHEHARPHLPLLDPILARADYSFPMCSLCKKIFVFGDWMEVEDAVARLGMFDSARPPALDYGCCDACRRLLGVAQGSANPA